MISKQTDWFIPSNARSKKENCAICAHESIKLLTIKIQKGFIYE